MWNVCRRMTQSDVFIHIEVHCTNKRQWQVAERGERCQTELMVSEWGSREPSNVSSLPKGITTHRPPDHPTNSQTSSIRSLNVSLRCTWRMIKRYGLCFHSGNDDLSPSPPSSPCIHTHTNQWQCYISVANRPQMLHTPCVPRGRRQVPAQKRPETPNEILPFYSSDEILRQSIHYS